MSANPHANGGLLLHELGVARLPRLRRQGARAGSTTSEATRVTGQFLRDVIKRNPDDVPAVRPGRDEFQPPQSGL